MNSRGELTTNDILRSNILLNRILTDFNPQEFTERELKIEMAQGQGAGPFTLRMNINTNLSILVDRGMVEKVDDTTYCVTEAGSQFDFYAWINNVEDVEDE